MCVTTHTSTTRQATTAIVLVLSMHLSNHTLMEPPSVVTHPRAASLKKSELCSHTMQAIQLDVNLTLTCVQSPTKRSERSVQGRLMHTGIPGWGLTSSVSNASYAKASGGSTEPVRCSCLTATFLHPRVHMLRRWLQVIAQNNDFAENICMCSAAIYNPVSGRCMCANGLRLPIISMGASLKIRTCQH